VLGSLPLQASTLRAGRSAEKLGQSEALLELRHIVGSFAASTGRRFEGRPVQAFEKSGDEVAEVLQHSAHVHRLGIIGRSEPQGARGILRYVRSDDSLGEAAVGGSTGPLAGPPRQFRKSCPNFLEDFGEGAGNCTALRFRGPVYPEVLDYPAKSRTFAAFPEHEAGLKTAEKVPNNPRKTGPGPVDRK
jgi:hypothetical protein